MTVSLRVIVKGFVIMRFVKVLANEKHGLLKAGLLKLLVE